jgi:hypothetical protein
VDDSYAFREIEPFEEIIDMKLDRRTTRRLGATLGAGAVAAAASLVVATGVSAQGFGSEDPLTDDTTSETSTTEAPDPTTVYSPPTIEPEDPGVPGNEGSENGDIG